MTEIMISRNPRSLRRRTSFTCVGHHRPYVHFHDARWCTRAHPDCPARCVDQLEREVRFVGDFSDGVDMKEEACTEDTLDGALHSVCDLVISIVGNKSSANRQKMRPT